MARSNPRRVASARRRPTAGTRRTSPESPTSPIATVRPADAGAGLVFRAGPGVGTVTRPGLPDYIASRTELVERAGALFEVVRSGQVKIEILQRYALMVCGVIGLIAGLHNPGRGGQNGYATLLAIAAVAGGGVAARQSWIQWYPPAVSECGPGLEYMLERFPLASSLPMIFRGAGDCSVVDWTFLGLSIANWSLLSFTTILVALTVYLLQRARQTR